MKWVTVTVLVVSAVVACAVGENTSKQFLNTVLNIIVAQVRIFNYIICVLSKPKLVMTLIIRNISQI